MCFSMKRRSKSEVSNPIRESQNFKTSLLVIFLTRVSNPIRESQNMKIDYKIHTKLSFKPYKGKSKLNLPKLFELIKSFQTL